MKIQARFSSMPPQGVDCIQRMKIEHSQGMEIEIVENELGFYILLDHPVGDQLIVYPHAANAICIYSGRRKD